MTQQQKNRRKGTVSQPAPAPIEKPKTALDETLQRQATTAMAPSEEPLYKGKPRKMSLDDY